MLLSGGWEGDENKQARRPAIKHLKKLPGKIEVMKKTGQWLFLKGSMEIFVDLLPWFIFLLTLPSCNSPSRENVLTTSTEHAFDTVKTQIRYASGFTLLRKKDHTVVDVFSSKQKKTLLFRYVLYPKGRPQPVGYEGAQFVATPVTSFVALSCIYVAYASMLGMEERLVAVSKRSHIYDPAVLRLIDSGKVLEVGEGGSMNLEKVFALKPELIVTYGSGDPKYDSHPKLMEAGFKVSVNVEHLETSPLARMEWIKFFAAFFGKERKADSLFAVAEKEYGAMAALAKNVKSRPSVFVDIKYGDTWYMPGGKSFMARLLNDAGADYLWKGDSATGSLQIDFETVFQKASQADFWLNTGSWETTEDAIQSDQRYARFKALKTGSMYNYNKRISASGGNDYWESGFVHPQVVLADLIEIFHPGLLPGHECFYYNRLEKK